MVLSLRNEEDEEDSALEDGGTTEEDLVLIPEDANRAVGVHMAKDFHMEPMELLNSDEEQNSHSSNATSTWLQLFHLAICVWNFLVIRQ